MTNRRFWATAAVSLALIPAACTTGEPEVEAVAEEPVTTVASDEDAGATSTTAPTTTAVIDIGDPARCVVEPLRSPFGGIELLISNVGDSPENINLFRDGELITTVEVAPNGIDPKDRDENYLGVAFFTDYEEITLGSTVSYIASTTGDPADGDTCGSLTLPEEWPAPECSVEIVDGFPRLTLDQGSGLPQFLRNGEPFQTSEPRPLSGEIVDSDPPIGTPLAYTVIADNYRWPSTTSQCGTVTVTEAIQPASRLDLAAERLAGTIGPFWYTTMSPICPDCEPDLEVTYAFDFTGAVLGTWRNGFAVDPSDDLWTIPPIDLAQHLLDATADGKAVEVDFAPSSSVIERWTIDGIGAVVLCAGVDTAPPELRTPFCNPEYFN